MALNYNNLWKLLIDKGLRKNDLCQITGMSRATLAKLVKGENVQTEVLERICLALNCQIGDIVKLVKDNNNLQADNCGGDSNGE